MDRKLDYQGNPIDNSRRLLTGATGSVAAGATFNFPALIDLRKCDYFALHVQADVSHTFGTGADYFDQEANVLLSSVTLVGSAAQSRAGGIQQVRANAAKPYITNNDTAPHTYTYYVYGMTQGR